MSQHADTLQPAISILREAETDLRNATAKAAAAGAYDNVLIISQWAKTLQSILLEVGSASNGNVTESTDDPNVGPVGGTTAIRNARIEAVSKKPSRGQPVYRRDAEYLVKCARSRKTRGEYEHRAPGEIALVLAECLAEWRSTKKLLTAEQLLESYVKRKGSVVSYQVYVALGWLMQIGLVRRHGRSGYSVPSPSTIINDVQTAWTKLGAVEAQ